MYSSKSCYNKINEMGILYREGDFYNTLRMYGDKNTRTFKHIIYLILCLFFKQIKNTLQTYMYAVLINSIGELVALPRPQTPPVSSPIALPIIHELVVLPWLQMPTSFYSACSAPLFLLWWSYPILAPTPTSFSSTLWRSTSSLLVWRPCL